MGKMVDISNQRFGFLVAIKPIKKTKDRAIIWLCKCDCGNLCEKVGHDLRQGKIISCGHYHRFKVGEKFTKHGELKGLKPLNAPRLYMIWVDMRKRCNNKNRRDYKYYGNKNISICDEWNWFPNFKRWALSNGYESHLTIDRINSRRGYSPDNCQWITHSENARKAQLERYGRSI